MPNIFASAPGRVMQIAGNSLPMTIRFGNFAKSGKYDIWRGFQSFKSIITGLSFQQQSGFQILHTLNQFIYIYNFGERSSDLMINGLCFMANCTDSVNLATGIISTPTGLEHVIKFYKQNRLSTSGAPLSFTIGTTIALKGFLVGLRTDMTDPNSGIAQFSMQFKVPPT